MPRAHTGERECAEEVILGKLDRHPHSGPKTESLSHTIYKDQPQTLKVSYIRAQTIQRLEENKGKSFHDIKTLALALHSLKHCF